MAGSKSPQRHNITLTPTQTTLLITLYARVLDAAQPKPLVNDTLAAGVLGQIEHTSLNLSGGHTGYMVLLRGRQLDQWTTEFLAKNPEATVLHLACGLDSRHRRVRWNAPGTNVRWIDVDFPEVVDLRRKLYEEPDGDYRLIAANVTDEEWLTQIPADRPTVVVLEGLTAYLTKETGMALIGRLVDHFNTGELLFDTIGPVVIRMQSIFAPVGRVGARFSWGVKHPRVIERLRPNLKLRNCQHLTDIGGFDDVPWSVRSIFTAYRHLPALRNFHLTHRFEF